VASHRVAPLTEGPAARQLDRLLRRAHLYDDPAAYTAGVQAAVEVLLHLDAAAEDARRAHPANASALTVVATEAAGGR
jgi:hypothetical protein